MRKGPDSFAEAVLLALAVMVMTVWSLSVLVQLAFPSRPVPGTVNVVGPIVATFLFGAAAYKGRKKNGNGGGPS